MAFVLIGALVVLFLALAALRRRHQAGERDARRAGFASRARRSCGGMMSRGHHHADRQRARRTTPVRRQQMPGEVLESPRRRRPRPDWCAHCRREILFDSPRCPDCGGSGGVRRRARAPHRRPAKHRCQPRRTGKRARRRRTRCLPGLASLRRSGRARRGSSRDSRVRRAPQPRRLGFDPLTSLRQRHCATTADLQVQVHAVLHRLRLRHHLEQNRGPTPDGSTMESAASMSVGSSCVGHVRCGASSRSSVGKSSGGGSTT